MRGDDGVKMVSYFSIGGLDPPNKNTTSTYVEKLDQRVKPADGERRIGLIENALPHISGVAQ